MKSLYAGVSGNSFRTAIFSLLLVLVSLVSPDATAQTITSADNSYTVSGVPGGFQAAIHPVYNSLKMKVHVLNPKAETVTVIIYNENLQEVYKKRVGKEAVIHGSFDVAQMPNGMYTITVRSGKKAFSRSFTIQTQQERIARAL